MDGQKKVTFLLENKQITEIEELRSIILSKYPKGLKISNSEIVKMAIDYFYTSSKKRNQQQQGGENHD